MKNLALIIICAFFSSILVAQPRNGLKGPAAKNWKPWQDKSKSVTLVQVESPKRLQGPAAKNYKPWRDPEKQVKEVKVQRTVPKLQGPAAKNWKPWKK